MSMSILNALASASTNLGQLKDTLVKARDFLVRQKAQFPDLAEQIDPQIADVEGKIAELDAAMSPDALIGLAAAILPELKNIGTFHFVPRPHAGDAI